VGLELRLLNYNIRTYIIVNLIMRNVEGQKLLCLTLLKRKAKLSMPFAISKWVF
jgi:hypothetical protein